jgi:cell division protein FtsB
MARRRSRRGQQGWSFWRKLFKFLTLVALLAATGFYGFQVGQKLAGEQIAAANAEIARLTESDAQAREHIAKLEAERDEHKARADDLAARYAQAVPSEDMKELTQALRAKLDSGLDAKRLGFVIANAERPKRCGAETTKRFMVKTAKFGGDANTWVRFADLITITADGTGSGAEQAFDPEKPVTVHFTPIGGKDVEVQGKLPLQHAMVVKGGEYRFTITPGAKGFVEVTGDRCDYRG